MKDIFIISLVSFSVTFVVLWINESQKRRFYQKLFRMENRRVMEVLSETNRYFQLWRKERKKNGKDN